MILVTGATGFVGRHVDRLRRKREADSDHPAFILTVHGQGYTCATT